MRFGAIAMAKRLLKTLQASWGVVLGLVLLLQFGRCRKKTKHNNRDAFSSEENLQRSAFNVHAEQRRREAAAESVREAQTAAGFAIERYENRELRNASVQQLVDEFNREP